jgi:hypothetical protein
MLIMDGGSAVEISNVVSRVSARSMMPGKPAPVFILSELDV